MREAAAILTYILFIVGLIIISGSASLGYLFAKLCGTLLLLAFSLLILLCVVLLLLFYLTLSFILSKTPHEQSTPLAP